MSVYDAALAEAWAMRRFALDNLLAIASRQNDVSVQALERYRAERAADGERYRIRDDVAILDIEGPLFKKANLFQEVSGATSYQVLARDFQLALDDESVSGILLNIDSPGGAVSGCDELAAMIAEARGVKPIHAFVSGNACSAAYWIASAAQSITLSETSEVGSIGVILSVTDRTEADAKSGVRQVEFVSSKAPGKRPDYDTDAGKAAYQLRADNIEAVFIENIAKNRGVTAEDVIQNFGAGGVEIGASAVQKGMADAVGSFEDVFAQLTRGTTRRKAKSPKGKLHMKDNVTTAGAEAPAFTQAQVDAAVATALAAQTARFEAITGSADGMANPKLAKTLAGNPKLSAEDALAILKDAGPSVIAASPTDKQAEFLERKEAAGGIGFAEDVGDKPAVKAAGWGKAVARANSRIVA